MNELLDLGFSPEDCLKALKLKDNDVQEAAVWLTENCKLQKPKQDTLNVTQVEVKYQQIFIYSFRGNDYKEKQNSRVVLSYKINMHGILNE